MTFREYMLHQLREMRRELLDSVSDLDEEDLHSFEPVGHWPVAWIAEHCTDVADIFLYAPLHGGRLHRYAEHVEGRSKREPRPGDAYPPLAEVESRWKAVCDAVIAHVESADEAGLQESPGREPYVQSILRVINHTNSHLRSLWCILGERRVDHKWHEQQNFLA